MLPRFDLNDCPDCQEELDDFLDGLQEHFPSESRDATIPQQAAAIAGLGMCCLGQLHQQGHPATLMEYGRSIHVPGAPDGTLT